MAGELNRSPEKILKPPPAMQKAAVAESTPGAGPTGRRRLAMEPGQAQFLSRTQHIGLSLCFSFVVGVWGGDWGREGRAILGFWFVSY